MTKTQVLIESYLEENPNRVCVYEFNEHINDLLIDIEVCSKDEAYGKYEVVGEIRQGEVFLFEDSGDEDEELDMYDEEFEDFEDE